jgi:hypothetical protein
MCAQGHVGTVEAHAVLQDVVGVGQELPGGDAVQVGEVEKPVGMNCARL